MKYLVFLLVAFLFVACSDSYNRKREPRLGPDAGPCGRTFVVSTDFPENERAAIERAALRWNAVATEQLCVTIGEVDPTKDQTIIFRIAQDSDYWRELSAHYGGGYILGVHYAQIDLIGIIDTMPIEQFELVALHEFGHAHGLGHTASPAVMHAYVGTSEDFTEIDLEECRRVGACPGPRGSSEVLQSRPDVEVLFQ